MHDIQSSFNSARSAERQPPMSGSGTIGGVDSARALEIPRLLSEVAHALASVDGQVSALEERLLPVLAPSELSDGKSLREEASTSVGSHLIGQRDELWSLSNRLKSILARLEV